MFLYVGFLHFTLVSGCSIGVVSMTSAQLPTDSLKDLAEQKEKEWRDIQHLRLVFYPDF